MINTRPTRRGFLGAIFGGIVAAQVVTDERSQVEVMQDVAKERLREGGKFPPPSGKSG